MNDKIKYLIKNTSILAISSFSSKILVFLLVPLYTRVLSAEEYGIYDLLVTTIQLLVPIFTLNIADGVLRFLMDEDINADAVKYYGLKYTSLAVVIFGSVLLFNHYLGISILLKEYELYAFIYYTFYAYNQLFMQAAKGQEKIHELAIAGVISTGVTITANITLLLFFSCGLKGFFAAYNLGLFVSAAYLCLNINDFRPLKRQKNKEVEINILSYALPLIMTALGWWINNVSDRYIVVWICGVAANGIYSVAYKIPTIITTLQNIFIQAWTVSAIKEYGENKSDEFYRNTFLVINFIMVISCSILILLTKVIAKILYAKDFYMAWKYVPFLLIGCIFSAAAGFLGPILSAKMESGILAKSTIYGALTNIVLNIVLVYFLHAQGAAVATAISSFVIYAVRQKAVGNSLIRKNRHKIFVSWIVAVLQAAFLILDFGVTVQMLLLFMELWLYKETIKNMVSKMFIIVKE